MNPKKEQIIDAALALFVNKGFSQTSIQDILDEANVAKGTFYNYFASKNECLMAILDYVNEKGNQKRQELAEGRKPTDERIFMEQVAVRFHMNRDYNVMTLFETVAFSNDKNFMEFMKKQHKEEIQWVGQRLVEIFHLDTKDYMIDHAIIFLSMIHHFMHVSKISDHEVEIEDVIRFSFNRLKPIVEEQVNNGEIFYHQHLLHSSEDTEGDLRKDLINELNALELAFKNSATPKIEEYVRFLIKEVTVEHPNIFVMESVLSSLGQAVRQTKFEPEVRSLSQLLSQWSNNR